MSASTDTHHIPPSTTSNSTPSSTTLNSIHSGLPFERGESSSQSPAGGRGGRGGRGGGGGGGGGGTEGSKYTASTTTGTNTGINFGTVPGASPALQSPSPDVGSQEVRRAKSKKTAGFLLPSAFRRSSDSPRSSTEVPNTGRSSFKGEKKKKKNVGDENGRAELSRGTNGTGKTSRFSEVFSPVHPPVDGSRDSKRSTHHDISMTGAVAVDERDHAAVNDQMESSQYQEEPETPATAPATAPASAASIDTSQIVNMALNLSEGRRRNFSSGNHLLPAPVVPSGRRVLSSGVPVLHGNYGYGAGGSLRQHLQQQRLVSNTVSPPSTQNHSPASRLLPSSATYAAARALEPSFLDESTYALHFSPATLARAEKARKFIELSVEFRRLLQFLPPLDQDAKSTPEFSAVRPGASDPSVPSTGYEPELGRVYNPLQLVRNRKARIRARTTMNPGVVEWNDSTDVREWIDKVEYASSEPGYKRGDTVALPSYPPLGLSAAIRQHAMLDPVMRDRKQDDGTAGRSPRPRMDWFTSPQELLADAYWLEQGGNKAMIEDRHGKHIYPSMVTVEPPLPRASIDSKRSNQGSLNYSGGSQQYESDAESQHEDRGRRRHLLHKHHHHNTHGRTDSTSRLKSVWHKARRRSRSPSSDLSHSDNDEKLAKTKLLNTRPMSASSQEENVGPLERHLKSMLNVETDAGRPNSSHSASPGTPNNWGLEKQQPGGARLERQRGEADLASLPAIRTDIREWSSPLDGAKSTPEKYIEQEGRPSFDDLSTTNPGSPVMVPHIPSISLDLSPPGSRTQSPSRKAKLAIPFIRSDAASHGRKNGSNAQAASSSSLVANDMDGELSRQPTTNNEPPTSRPSLDAATSPQRNRRLFAQRTNESATTGLVRPSSLGKDAKPGKEAESAVRRFFKGGRLGEIVRSEVGDRMRKKDPNYEEAEMSPDTMSDSPGMASDTEDTSGTTGGGGKGGRRSMTKKAMAASQSQRQDRSTFPLRKRDKPRYHMDLPIFRPASSPAGSQPTTPNQDRNTELKRLQAQNRPRVPKSAPDFTVELGRMSSNDSNSIYLTQTRSSMGTAGEYRGPNHSLANFNLKDRSLIDGRIPTILDRHGGVDESGFPATGLSKLRNHILDSSSQLGPASDQRHWSISDKKQSPRLSSSSIDVSGIDIARVRALLLCSGIKAAEQVRRADTPRNPPSKLLLQAAESSGTSIGPVPVMQEHQLTARLLTRQIDKDSMALHRSAELFRSQTVSSLRTELAALHETVSTCIEHARGTGDEAVGFGALITGQKTIEVQRVVDSLELFRRKRRRRLRLIRRVAFGLLEWALLFFMWLVWLVVVVVKGVLGVGKGAVRVVRWVFWL